MPADRDHLLWSGGAARPAKVILYAISWFSGRFCRILAAIRAFKELFSLTIRLIGQQGLQRAKHAATWVSADDAGKSRLCRNIARSGRLTTRTGVVPAATLWRPLSWPIRKAIRKTANPRPVRLRRVTRTAGSRKSPKANPRSRATAKAPRNRMITVRNRAEDEGVGPFEYGPTFLIGKTSDQILRVRIAAIQPGGCHVQFIEARRRRESSPCPQHH